MIISFNASLPDIQSAISVGGDGATRVKLDIPSSDIAEAVKLTLLRGQAFTVIIQPLENDAEADTKARDILPEIL